MFFSMLKGKDMRAALVCLIALSLTPGVFAATLDGVWELTITRFGYPSYRRATLESKGDRLTGKSGDLTIEGTAHGDSVALTASSKDGKPFGEFKGTMIEGVLVGTARVRDEAV